MFNGEKVSTSEATVSLTLDSHLFYEINAYLQTPFDDKPHMTGAFILSSHVPVSEKFTEPKYQKLMVRERPYISAFNWPECFSTTFIYASFYKSSNFRFIHKNISYLLTELSKRIQTRIFFVVVEK